MKNLGDLNASEGITLYAYAVSGKVVTNFMKLSELEQVAKPEGATVVKTTITGVHF